jgi:hypothetical protein
MNSATIAAADGAASQDCNTRATRVTPGSDLHRSLFCRALLDSFVPARPAEIVWPPLSADVGARLASLPIWDIALQTEGRARLRVLNYARTVEDPLLRSAFEVLGLEEGRHKEVLARMVAAYRLPAGAEPPYLEPQDAEWGLMVTGYSACIDSFFAFGRFALVRRGGLFPAALLEIFDPILQEEARHILFFTNWLAWHRRRLPAWRQPLFLLKTVAVWGFLVRERLGLARDIGGRGRANANFTASGAQTLSGQPVDVAELMDLCLAEQARRLAVYDRRLRRPALMSRLVRLARRFVRRRQD